MFIDKIRAGTIPNFAIVDQRVPLNEVHNCVRWLSNENQGEIRGVFLLLMCKAKREQRLQRCRSNGLFSPKVAKVWIIFAITLCWCTFLGIYRLANMASLISKSWFFHEQVSFKASKGKWYTLQFIWLIGDNFKLKHVKVKSRKGYSACFLHLQAEM